MSLALSPATLVLVVMCLASAVFYVVGTAAMKLYGHVPFAALMIPVGIAFIAAAWFEVAVLRSARVGQVFLLIFAFEVILTSLFAFIVLKERYSVRELFGLATIVAGIVVLVPGSGARFTDGTILAGSAAVSEDTSGASRLDRQPEDPSGAAPAMAATAAPLFHDPSERRGEAFEPADPLSGRGLWP